MYLIVLFNLKDPSKLAAYEEWAKTVDVPNVTRLQSVDDFKVFKTTGLLGTDAPAPYAYVEVIHVNDQEQLFKDISTENMQKVATQFQEFADHPIFMVTHQIA